jgi:hypothetical protein
VADLLRTFIREAVLHELHGYERLAAALHGSGLGAPTTAEALEAQHLADGWVLDTELRTGEPVPPAVHGAANRFVAKQWKGLLERFRGDRWAAQQTLLNLLDAELAASGPGPVW